MNLREKFRKQKEQLLKRHSEQIESVNDKTEFPTIFDMNKIPKGIEFWRPKKGDHLIDIIPFFAGPNHPKVKEGDIAYVVDLFVHQGIGPNREPFVCQMKNFKTPDPICDYIFKNRLPTDEWKKFAPKRRTVYLVWVHDTPDEEEKGLQIWEVSHFFFENFVDEIAKSPRGGGAVVFSDLDHGKSIAFSIRVSGRYKDATGTDRDSVSYVGHRFVDREEPIPDSIVEQSFSLDSCIKMHPNVNEMKMALEYMVDDDEIQPQQKSKPFSKLQLNDDNEEDIDIPDPPSKPSRKTKDEEDDDEEEFVCEFFGKNCGYDDNCEFCSDYDECKRQTLLKQKRSRG